MAQYTPEEIVVKTVDNKLLVHAKHEEKSETKSVYREYNREFLLPKGTNPELIRSSLSKVSYFHVWILSSLFGFWPFFYPFIGWSVDYWSPSTGHRRWWENDSHRSALMMEFNFWSPPKISKFLKIEFCVCLLKEKFSNLFFFVILKKDDNFFLWVITSSFKNKFSSIYLRNLIFCGGEGFT